MVAIWRLFFLKDAKRVKRLLKLQDNIVLKCRKSLLNDQKPFGEIRIPAMILAVSGLIFNVIAFSFGIGYNRLTMQPEFFYLMDPSPDIINPMQQFPEYCWIVMIIGYYITVGILIWSWFEYCKWKWVNLK